MNEGAEILGFPIDGSNDPERLDEMYEMIEFLVEAEQRRQAQDVTRDESLWNFKYTGTFRKLKSYFEKLKNTFDDVHDRIQYLGIIKDLINKLKNDLNKDIYKYERRICVILYDAIHKAKAETLNKDHLTILDSSLEILFRGKCDKKDFFKVDRLLRKNGLNWIVGDDFDKFSISGKYD